MEPHVAKLLKEADPKQYQKELDAQKIVRIIFKQIDGQRHSFLKNNQACYLEDGKEYRLPEHIVQTLENNLMPHYTIEGDIEAGPTMKRNDRPRFIIKRLPDNEASDEEKRAFVIDALSKNPGRKTENKTNLIKQLSRAERKAAKKAEAEKEGEDDVVKDDETGL